MRTIKENAKAVVAFFTSLGTWGATAMADNRIDGVEAFGLCGVFVATFSVWIVSNAPTEQELQQLEDWKNN